MQLSPELYKRNERVTDQPWSKPVAAFPWTPKIRQPVPQEFQTTSKLYASKRIKTAKSLAEYYLEPLRWTFRLDLLTVLESALGEWRPRFTENMIVFEERIHPSIDAATVAGDPFLLHRALGQLLRNALEATEPTGRVGFYARRNSRGQVEISVVDSGLGIEANDIGRIFTPFFSTKRKHVGLGLNIALRYVNLHRGTLRIDSTWGEGTNAEVILPPTLLNGR